MRHPAVLEAAAVGVPSELGEDDILLVVTLRQDAALDYAELLDFCAARMPYFCVPRFVEMVNELPKNVHRANPQRFVAYSRLKTGRLGSRKPRLHSQSVS